MSIAEDPDKADALILRVKALLLKPAQTWDVIEAEPATIRGLYTGYVAPLAAIGPVCTVIGQLAFGARGNLDLVYRPPIARVLLGALVSWVVALAGVYIFALILEAMSPQFGGRKDRLESFKLAAYTGTAVWVAGLFMAFPPISMLSVVGIYSVYLLFVGLPKLMKVSGDKAMLFTVCALVAGVGISFLVGIVRSFLPI